MQEWHARSGCPGARTRPRSPGGDRADADLLRRAAAWLRTHLRESRDAGLDRDEDAHALAALLEVLAVELPHLDPELRRRAVASCREALREVGLEPCPDRVARRTRIRLR